MPPTVTLALATSAAGTASACLPAATTSSSTSRSLAPKSSAGLVAQPIDARPSGGELATSACALVAVVSAAVGLLAAPSAQRRHHRLGRAGSAQRGSSASPGVRKLSSARPPAPSGGSVGASARLRLDHRQQLPAALAGARLRRRDRCGEVSAGGAARARTHLGRQRRLHRDEAQPHALLRRARLAALVGDVGGHVIAVADSCSAFSSASGVNLTSKVPSAPSGDAPRRSSAGARNHCRPSPTSPTTRDRPARASRASAPSGGHRQAEVVARLALERRRRAVEPHGRAAVFEGHLEGGPSEDIDVAE